MHLFSFIFYSFSFFIFFTQRDTDGWTILRSHIQDDSISEQPYSAAAWMLFPPKGKYCSERTVLYYTVQYRTERTVLNRLYCNVM